MASCELALELEPKLLELCKRGSRQHIARKKKSDCLAKVPWLVNTCARSIAPKAGSFPPRPMKPSFTLRTSKGNLLAGEMPEYPVDCGKNSPSMFCHRKIAPSYRNTQTHTGRTLFPTQIAAGLEDAVGMSRYQAILSTGPRGRKNAAWRQSHLRKSLVAIGFQKQPNIGASSVAENVCGPSKSDTTGSDGTA